jgi:CheY-like chemotaxis protein
MPPRNSTPKVAPARILLVDDNPHGLSARKCVLQELGATVVTCSAASEALQLFAERPFDLVVTDYKMPRMNGDEFIVSLRRIDSHVPVILVSGFADSLGLNENNTGADAVIMKSNNEVAHMVRWVTRLLKKKKPPQSQKGSRSKNRIATG